MIMSEIRDYLTERHCVPIGDMVNRFGVEPNALRGMLQRWIDKGRLRRLDTGATCTGCSKCDAFNLETYEWIGEPRGD